MGTVKAACLGCLRWILDTRCAIGPFDAQRSSTRVLQNAWPDSYAYEGVESKEVKWEEIEMNRILAVLAVVAMAGTIPTVSSATPTECNGTITGTVNGALTISDSDSCDLEGATIHGGIDMTGGSLLVCNNSTIDGGINATGGSSLAKLETKEKAFSVSAGAQRSGGSGRFS